MSKIFEAIINHKKTVIIIFVIIAAVCGVLMSGVGQNYDMSTYLPKDAPSKSGIDILKTEYNYNGNAVAFAEDKSIIEVLEIKDRIEEVPGVENAVWLDDIIDITKPIETINEEIINN